MITRKKIRRLRLSGKQKNHTNYEFSGNLTSNCEMKQNPMVESSVISKQEITHKKGNEVLQIENPDQEISQMNIDDRIIKPRQIEEADDQSVVDIDLIYCHHCERSYAPETFKKFCQKVDENGVPKCLSMRNKKRKVFNSAKVSFFLNRGFLTPSDHLYASRLYDR